MIGILDKWHTLERDREDIVRLGVGARAMYALRFLEGLCEQLPGSVDNYKIIIEDHGLIFYPDDALWVFKERYFLSEIADTDDGPQNLPVDIGGGYLSLRSAMLHYEIKSEAIRKAG